jgi:hypothetical protein
LSNWRRAPRRFGVAIELAALLLPATAEVKLRQSRNAFGQFHPTAVIAAWRHVWINPDQ